MTVNGHHSTLAPSTNTTILPTSTPVSTPEMTTSWKPSNVSCRTSFPLTEETISLSEQTPVLTPIYIAMVAPPSDPTCRFEYSLNGSLRDYIELNHLNGLLKLIRPINVDEMLRSNLLSNGSNGSFRADVNFRAQLRDLPDIYTTMTLHVSLYRSGQLPSKMDGVHFSNRVYLFNITEELPLGKKQAF